MTGETKDDQLLDTMSEGIQKIIPIYDLRGYCTPDQFFDCLCIFLKNYNTLVASKIYFLLVTFQGT